MYLKDFLRIATPDLHQEEEPARQLQHPIPGVGQLPLLVHHRHLEWDVYRQRSFKLLLPKLRGRSLHHHRHRLQCNLLRQ